MFGGGHFVTRVDMMLVMEACSKMDKTEVDDLKTGMEKERCKIHYFQAGQLIHCTLIQFHFYTLV